MKLLTIIISTLNKGIVGLEKTVSFQHPDICYLIVHQNHDDIEIPNQLLRDDITIITTQTKGLSNSRNIGISNCTTKYGLIADDDVTYIESGLLEILTIIENDKFDVATFKIKTLHGEPEYKNYPFESLLIKEDSKHWVSSIEILLNIESIKSKDITFDNRFGLGTFLRKGEEQILLFDAMKCNMIIKYFPIYIVNHPYESSGKKKSKEMFNYFYRGAFDQRVRKTCSLSDLTSNNLNIIRKTKSILSYYLGVFYSYCRTK